MRLRFLVPVLLSLALAPATVHGDEDAAAKWIDGLGANVTRDEKQPGRPIAGVDTIWTHLTDAGLKELVVTLAGLEHLDSLNLRGSKVTDAGY